MNETTNDVKLDESAITAAVLYLIRCSSSQESERAATREKPDEEQER